MNCNPCCGCFPPITTYNPSAADNFPTILQQVEYLKALLKKYPSQQWFITQEKVTEETVKLDSTKISLRGRVVAVGDFILGNKVIENDDGTFTTLATLMFQYTGATIEVTNYVVEFVGIYSEQGLADQALSLAHTNEQDIARLDSEIVDKVDKITQKSEYIQIYGVSKEGKEAIYELSEMAIPWKIVRRDFTGSFDIPAPTKSTQPVRKAEFDFELSQKQKLLSGEKKFLFNGKEVFAPDYTGGTMVVSKGLKTIFGNQSLVGMGNIDLYRHHINITGQNEKFNFKSGEIYIDFISSNNLNVDSLTDLKTLLGNTFKIQAYGGTVKALPDNVAHALYMNESNLTILDEITNVREDASLSFLSFTDTVTTI